MRNIHIPEDPYLDSWPLHLALAPSGRGKAVPGDSSQYLACSFLHLPSHSFTKSQQEGHSLDCVTAVLYLGRAGAGPQK